MCIEMLRNLLLCISVLFLVTNRCRAAPRSRNTTRTFLLYGYAVYKPGWSLDQDGHLQLWFKTEKQDAMLLYEDDSNDVGQFLDVFLVKGKLRLRMAMGDCSYAERIVNGSFADLNWHKLIIRRDSGRTFVAVDNITADPIKCSAQLSSMVAIYAGYLTLSQRDEGAWVFPTALWQSMQYGFVGCTRGMRYTYRGKQIKPKLRRTNGTKAGCSNPCSELKCRHGGRCVNRIFSAECDCRETGYEGKRCARVIRTPPTLETFTTPTTTSSSSSEVKSGPKPKQQSKAAAKARKPNTAPYYSTSLLAIWASIGLSAMVLA